MSTRPKKKTAKPRAPKATSDAKFADEVERANWPEIEKKLAAARASVKKGKLRKWNLDRFLADVEKRRRAKVTAVNDDPLGHPEASSRVDVWHALG